MAMNNKGYTLLELAIVLAILGSLLMAAFGFALPILRANDRIETAAKMKIIAREIDRFVLENYRLPCPDDSWDAVNGRCTSTRGQVPVDELELSPDLLQDAYSQDFEYMISPAFAQDTRDANLLVHPRCRTRDWYYRDIIDKLNALHKAPRKARFCCPGEDIFPNTTDLTITDENGNVFPAQLRNADESNSVDAVASADPLVAESECAKLANEAVTDTGLLLEDGYLYEDRSDEYRFKACLGYAQTDKPFSLTPNTMVPPGDPVTAVAYVLTSHGPDQDNDAITGTQVTVLSDPEAVDDYDDIVTWKTQHNIMEESNESCVFP